jgi:hypothetical protein
VQEPVDQRLKYFSPPAFDASARPAIAPQQASVPDHDLADALPQARRHSIVAQMLFDRDQSSAQAGKSTAKQEDSDFVLGEPTVPDDVFDFDDLDEETLDLDAIEDGDMDLDQIEETSIMTFGTFFRQAERSDDSQYIDVSFPGQSL